MNTPDDLVEDVRAVLEEHPVAFAYLFGSRGRGDHGPESDVDVAVYLDDHLDPDERFRTHLRIGAELESALKRRVDVVVLNDAPLRLAGRIVTEHETVLGHDEPRRVRYEVDLFPQYIDFEHHARQLDRELLRATAEGRR